MTSARERARDREDPGGPPSGDGPEAGPPEPPSERIRSLLEVFHAAFDEGEPQDLTPYVHRPCTVVTRWGAYALADREQIDSAFRSVQRDFLARGCQRTERRDLRVRMLDDRLARARVLTVRYEGEDREMERIATTYVLRRTREGWRIAVLVEHGAEEAADTA